MTLSKVTSPEGFKVSIDSVSVNIEHLNFGHSFGAFLQKNECIMSFINQSHSHTHTHTHMLEFSSAP